MNGGNDFGYFNTHVGYDFPFRGRLTFDLSYSRHQEGLHRLQPGVQERGRPRL
ncbi:MAG: hypothetical protein MZU84_08985 [Sphingobacterium sp.]|nr:hypothetical protein [Sphingobacterium sp.]